jgi:FtsP/CotA-like multicopper oxidase with cupredoxin domain
VREFTLTAQEVDWELFPGTTVRAWTYNGTVPGPELRVTEGDTVRVTLRNELPVPTAVHWHGIDVPNAMDGVPGLTQPPVQPGETFVYEFPATNPGTRWYHTHQDSEIQAPLGLYGPLIVEPKAPPAGTVAYSREYTYVLSEWALALTPQVALGEAALPASGPGAPHAKALDFDFFLINGKAHDAIPPIQLKQGERVRVRLINAGALVHTIHPHGHSFKIVATDGNFVPVANQLVKDSVTLGPSERVDIELSATNPGIWMFHCHMAHHAANGMMTTLRYEGAQPPVAGAGGGGHQHEAAPAAAAPTTPALAAADVPAGATKITMVDNRYQPGSITVKAGTTVAWANSGANVHTISSFTGAFESGSIATGQAFAFTFTQPGQYQYLCRQHLLNGMAGTIVVE